ncbi:hypothetical protein ACQKNC_21770 [Lysinibacillus sp. NPDC094177]|uniref:hypothetical protein n=1 Tax=Lysinibacillus sp. NPDC094177 TaxID=3390580 RepID=UPI003D04B8C1
MEKEKNVKNIEDEQIAEFVNEIDEKIMSVIYRLYDKTLEDFRYIKYKVILYLNSSTNFKSCIQKP